MYVSIYYVCVCIYIYIYIFVFTATSENSSVLNTIFICSFSLNYCDCLRSEYNFFKPRQIVRQKRCCVRQSEFQTGHKAKLFLEKSVALETICSSCTLINIKLRQVHVHQHTKEPPQFLNITQSPSLSRFSLSAVQ